tara:strand:- start:3239 stop:3637 length:399 start_codon:yes stop_codon:yes gene_type:complete
MRLINSNQILKNINDIIIIDVREGDFKGGNIINAVNIPYSSFSERLVLEKIKLTNKKLVVHCMYSSMRGPGTYYKLDNMLDDFKELYVLKNGFHNFINFCIKNNKMEYIENFKKENWILQHNNYTHITEVFN